MVEKKWSLLDFEQIAEMSASDKAKVSLVVERDKQEFYILKVFYGNAPTAFYRRLQSLESEAFPKIYSVWKEKEDCCVLEEYIAGETLQILLKTEKRITREELYSYLRELCEALSVLHTAEPPIIHRDIKPENILITGEGKLKLIDFDAAREYKAEGKTDTILLGTKEYAAPEQFGYAQTDARSDIYSTGIVLQELLNKSDLDERTGKLVQKVIDRATMFDPEKRYENIGKLWDELSKGLNPSYSRKRIIRTLAAFCGVGLISFGIWNMFQREEKAVQKPQTGLESKETNAAEVEDVNEALQPEATKEIVQKSDDLNGDETDTGWKDTWEKWKKEGALTTISAEYTQDEQLKAHYRYISILEEFMKKDPVIGTLHGELFDLPLGNQKKKEIYVAYHRTDWSQNNFFTVGFMNAYPRDIKIQNMHLAESPIIGVRLCKPVGERPDDYDAVLLTEGQYICEYENEVTIPAEFLKTLPEGEYRLDLMNRDYSFYVYLVVFGVDVQEDCLFTKVLSGIVYFSSESKNDVYFYVNNTHFPVKEVRLENEVLDPADYDLTDDGYGVVLHADVMERYSNLLGTEIKITVEDGTQAISRIINLCHYKGELQ